MKNFKILVILGTFMSFGTSLFSQTQIEGRIVEIMAISPSYVAVNDTILRNGTVNEPMHRELNSKPVHITISSINSTDDDEVIKDKAADLPTFNAPAIRQQPMMRFAGDPAFNDWVVYKTLKAKLAEENNDQ